MYLDVLSYLGHCAFLWSSPGGARVLIDPWGNSSDSYWFLKSFPETSADVALVTHDHFDHNAIERLTGTPSIVQGACDFRLHDLHVRGVQDLHSGRSGRRGISNTVFVIEAEGVRYCHIGDNRHDPSDDARAELGKVDVLMVTVDDSCHLLAYEQVDALVTSLGPRVVVPMHYYIEGLTTEESTLLSPELWLASQRRVVRLPENAMAITRDDLPDEREVWVFPTPIL